MKDITTRDMQLKEVKDIFARIENDFLPNEYPPYDALYHQIKSGVQRGLILCSGEQDVAYSVLAEHHVNEYILMSLLAVYEDCCGEGFGTSFLEKLKDSYSDKNGIIVEVEKPELATTADEKLACVRRIEFYQKSGFNLIPNVDYTIWGIPMHLMVLPLRQSLEEVSASIADIMHDIYLDLLGKRFIHKMHLELLKI